MVLSAVSGIAADSTSPPGSDAASATRQYYRLLLAQFNEADQGGGLDTFRQVVAPQPMTYGLVLSSEAIRHRQAPDAESGRRVRQAVKWLLDNRDLDANGMPGWGIPQAWDAFADGTENPPHTAYTITTAIVLEGLLEALALPEFWTTAERDEILQWVKRVQLHWCRDNWRDGFGGGFFQYSPRANDAIFSVNAPAMYLASMVRLLTRHGESLDDAERALVLQRTQALAQAIIQTAEPRHGLPYWPYTPSPNRLNRKAANDLVHHAYIVWGLETYRDLPAGAAIPWTREQALRSLDAYWRDDALSRYASGDPEVATAQANSPPRLWGTGMALAVCAKYGDDTQRERVLRELLRQHGPLPQLRLSAAETGSQPPFYPRHASHALFGLAHAAFGD